jgi:SAM-dependent methyltransferase
MRTSVHQEYRDHAADHWWFRARRHIFDRLLATRLQQTPNTHVLDLGPGSGVNLPILRPRGRVVAVDMDRQSLHACAERGADVAMADATALPFASDSFDLVCALDVLEHIDDHRAAASELARVLRPGSGLMLVSVPALKLLWGRQDVLSEHRRRYRRTELRDLLVAAGLRLERLTYFNFLLFPPILVARLLMRPFLSRSVAAGQSDLAMKGPALVDRTLERLFRAEGPWLARLGFPIGVSLLAIARKDGPSR